jgi:phosphatidylinositol-3-phosphatase
MRNPQPRALFLALALILGVACTNPDPATVVSSPPPTSVSAAPSSTPSANAVGAPPERVVVVILENHGYEQVIGNPEMPYLNGTILPSSVSLTAMHAHTHPSLPNYVYLTAGTTCDATTDGDWGRTCPSVFDQLLAHGIDWTTYAEGYLGSTSTCDLSDYSDGSTNDYARKHVPPLLFVSTSQGPACTQHVADVPGDTPADGSPPAANFAGVKLPPFTIVVPNQCHDMHNDTGECGTAGGGAPGADAWLAKNWPDLVRAAGPRGAVVLTWDEGTSPSQRIATLIGGEKIRGSGTTVGTAFDQASILRAIEDAFGLPCLAAACSATPIPVRVGG